jgi:hypothetical protein
MKDSLTTLSHQTCAISIIRIQYLHLSEDTTWDNVDSSCWSITELCSAILCVCLPVLRPLISKLMPNLMWSGYRKNSKGYQQHSSGNHGSDSNTYQHGNSIATDHRNPSHSSSERTFVNTSDVLHTEDLELQRASSEGDFSDHVFGLEDSKRRLESERYSAETLRGSRGAPRPAPVIAPAKATRMLGLQPSVTTEIKASTPEPPESSARRVPDHGITVHRDVVIDEV